MSAAVRLPLVPASEGLRRQIARGARAARGLVPEGRRDEDRRPRRRRAHGPGRHAPRGCRRARRLVGAVVSPRSAALGRDAGEVAGAGVAGVELTADTAVRAARRRRRHRLLDRAPPLPHLLQLAARAKVAVVSGTTRLDATCERLLDEAAQGRARPVGAEHQRRRAGPRRARRARGAEARASASTSRSSRPTTAPRSTRRAAPPSACAAPSRRRGAGSRPVYGREGNVGPARRRRRSRVLARARRRRHRRPHRPLPRPGRAARAHPPRDEPRPLRPRGAPGGALPRGQAAGALHDGRRRSGLRIAQTVRTPPQRG